MLDTETMTHTGGSSHLLETLAPIETDPLLGLIAMANADPRPDKIDVGVGVYRDGVGNTPILRCIKAAEQRLVETQPSKGYLGMKGNIGFARAMRGIVLGRHTGDDRIQGLQTPGGCGALCLAFKLIAQANPKARILVGTPTWPNHIPLIAAGNLEVVRYGFYDRDTQLIRFDEMLSMLDGAKPGDAVLLHGCCHNPTGADLDDEQWADVVRIVASRGLLPVVDLAYQGLGRGLEEDSRGLHLLLDACDEVIVAHSNDKNFGVYRDRVGSLWIKTAKSASTSLAMSHVSQLAREMWSMPPDHGAEAIHIILTDEALTADWKAELGEMRGRINRIRTKIAAADSRLAYVGGQYGMFSMLPLTPEQVKALREQHGIYMADSGRFNVVGMSDDAVDRFIAAVVGALEA